MSDDIRDPLEGLYKRVRSVCPGGLMENIPSSVLAIGALKEARPDLAKRVFIEGLLEPTREAFGESASILAYLDEIESRFTQEDTVLLFRDWEIAVMVEVFRPALQDLVERGGKMFRGEEGYLNSLGHYYVQEVTNFVQWKLAVVVMRCEKAVPLMLAAALVGEEALQAQISRHRDPYRGQHLVEIARMLCGNGFEPESPELERQMRVLESSNDEVIKKVFMELQGCWFSRREVIEERIRALIGIIEDTTF